ncbi:hypothetical protein TanjilG_12837 [Lupinus angustifolius]|uniref:C2 domain-containing protein n=1 Tax=Lupinus angustifolius TaxID=3871 RepID=A0A1J7HQ06_LUPAN|nr:PREDICTED: uncharacterized protein LOC109359184 [Lupinus angustifolius]OIW02523.1 hypothetical protein TanjilG_12837 [Lupinus angustifolius]
MGKIWVEVCLISARGVQASFSLWKRQWYAVGWVDPNNKYCTKVDASGNANPIWRTKFAIQVDDSEPNFQDLALNLEVYSRDPFFLTEKLHGSANVVLKEFLVKNSEISRARDEEVGSYQLRRKKSNKPRGFIDVSIRVSEDKEEPNSHQGDGGGIELIDRGNNIHLNTEGGFGQANMHQLPQSSLHGPQKQQHSNVPYNSHHPMQFPTNYSNPYVGGPNYPASAGPSYYQPPRPPPPPPQLPSNFGYVPTNFLPSNYGMAPSYINMPSSSSSSGAVPPRQRGPPPAGFAMGAGAGALAAGAVMFGDDFLSGFGVPSGIGDPTLVIATDPLF